MNKELAMKWVEALRSGKYEQGTEYLNNNGKFCYLGELCEIEGGFENKVHDVLSAVILYNDAFRQYPGRAIRTRYGHVPSKNDSLAQLNDSGSSFSEIADIIEKHYEEL